MNFYLKKTLSFIATLLFIAVFAFILFQAIPGDAALSKLGTEATEENAQALRELYGYNKSLPERFVSWFMSAVTGDFGVSFKYSPITVKKLIGERIPVTLALGFMALIMILIVSIPVGLLSAGKKNSFTDRLTDRTSQVFMAIPSFVHGILVTLIFGILLSLFIPGKYVSYSEDFGSFVKSLIFPAISIALPKIGMTVRFVKASVRKELNKDYVRTARAKGNSEKEVMWKHVFRNSLMPVITFVGLIVAEIMAGSIMTEQVFNLPGMGRLLVTSIANRDFNVVQAIVIYIAVIVIAVNFIIDILYKIADPRQ